MIWHLEPRPELVSLLGLAGQLDLLPVALTAVHEVEHRGALAEQARSMSRVSQILADQVRAYIGMIVTPVRCPAANAHTAGYPPHQPIPEVLRGNEKEEMDPSRCAGRSG